MWHSSCFISYSWDHRTHSDWVLRLAEDLAVNGVEVRLDRYQQPGSSLTQFMEAAVRESDVVALVCAPQFADKANRRRGGVGYETQVVTGALFEAVTTDKFIPLLRSGASTDALPTYLKGTQAIDFRLDDDYEDSLGQLVRRMWRAPADRPRRGERPSFGKGFRPRRHRGAELPRVLREPPARPERAPQAPDEDATASGPLVALTLHVEAVGRLRAYRDYFEDERRRIELEDEHGIRAFRPRMFVVVGRSGQLDPVTRRQLETQFSDITLRTWDDLMRVARARLGD